MSETVRGPAEGERAVRTAELAELLDLVRGAAQGAAQHVLVLGAEGMGKTILLRRLERAVSEEDRLAGQWLPLRLDECQYHLGGLADFWLEVLDVLSLATGQPEWAERARALPGSSPAEAVEEAARALVQQAAEELERRLLLIVDRLDLVLERIDGDVDASRLREVLQHEPWLMLVGASSQSIAATYDYEQPFYDLFHVLPLAALTASAAAELLGHLGKLAGVEREVAALVDHPRRWGLLHQLTGGCPRTLAELVEVLQADPGADLLACLDGLSGRAAPRHREMLAGLPRQAQRVLDGLLRSWDPATAETLAMLLRLDRGVVSGQLHRLVARGLAEKVDVPGRALGFQAHDRSLQLWHLCTQRRGRARLVGLLQLAEVLAAPSPVAVSAASGPAQAGPMLAELRAESKRATTSPGERVRRLADLAEAGDPTLALEARTLAQAPLERAPTDAAVRLDLCRLEVRLGRAEAALDHWRAAVSLLGGNLGTEPERALAVLAALSRAGAAAGGLDALEAQRLDPVWQPVLHALAILSQRDRERAKRLAPEMRSAVEWVQARLANGV